jgi:hypothetical protein
LVAYSAVLGTVAVLERVTTMDDISSSVVAAVEAASGKAFVHSALTGSWIAAPAGVKAGLPALARNGALFSETNGHLAFSARSGTFHRLTTGANTRVWVDGQSAVIAVTGPSKLHVFDARREVWIGQTIGTLRMPPSIWRTTLLLVDDTRAWGYAVQAGTIEAVPFAAKPLDVKPSSECGRVVAQDAVQAFSSIPDLTPLPQFPEFRRVMTRGAPLRLRLHTAPSAASILALSTFRRDPLNLPGIGSLWLELGSLVVGNPGVTGQGGLRAIDLPIPDQPALLGVELFFQAAVAPSAGTPYLTRLGSARIF